MRSLILFALLAGCSGPEGSASAVPADWIPVTASCGYTFMAPPDLVAKDVQPIDSCVDRWSVGSCSLTGDLGQYSGPAAETPGVIDFSESWEIIDGKMTQLATEQNPFGGAAFQFQSSAYFRGVNPDRPEVALSVSSSCARAEERDETLLLFRSIRFLGASAD